MDMFLMIAVCITLGIIDLMCGKIGLGVGMFLAVFLLLFIN